MEHRQKDAREGVLLRGLLVSLNYISKVKIQLELSFYHMQNKCVNIKFLKDYDSGRCRGSIG